MDSASASSTSSQGQASALLPPVPPSILKTDSSSPRDDGGKKRVVRRALNNSTTSLPTRTILKSTPKPTFDRAVSEGMRPGRAKPPLSSATSSISMKARLAKIDSEHIDGDASAKQKYKRYLNQARVCEEHGEFDDLEERSLLLFQDATGKEGPLLLCTRAT